MDSFSINEIGKFLDCEISCDAKIRVNKLSSLANADQNSVSFFSGNGYLDDLKNTKAKITKLAQGLPVGGEIESLDDGTLFSAFKNRSNLNSNSD